MTLQSFGRLFLCSLGFLKRKRTKNKQTNKHFTSKTCILPLFNNVHFDLVTKKLLTTQDPTRSSHQDIFSGEKPYSLSNHNLDIEIILSQNKTDWVFSLRNLEIDTFYVLEMWSYAYRDLIW